MINFNNTVLDYVKYLKIFLFRGCEAKSRHISAILILYIMMIYIEINTMEAVDLELNVDLVERYLVSLVPSHAGWLLLFCR